MDTSSSNILIMPSMLLHCTCMSINYLF